MVDGRSSDGIAASYPSRLTSTNTIKHAKVRQTLLNNRINYKILRISINVDAKCHWTVHWLEGLRLPMILLWWHAIWHWTVDWLEGSDLLMILVWFVEVGVLATQVFIIVDDDWLHQMKKLRFWKRSFSWFRISGQNLVSIQDRWERQKRQKRKNKILKVMVEMEWNKRVRNIKNQKKNQNKLL